MDTIEQELLTRRLQHGDEDAWRKLENEIKPIVRRLARRYFALGHTSRDVESEGVIGAHKGFLTWSEDQATPIGFAAMCAERKIQTLVTESRRRKHELLNLAADIYDEGLDSKACSYLPHEATDDEIDHDLLIDRLNEWAAKHLTEHQSNVFKATLSDRDAGYEQLAQTLGIDYKSFDNAVTLIRKKLRQTFVVLDPSLG